MCAWSGTMRAGPSSCLSLCISYPFLSLTPSLCFHCFTFCLHLCSVKKFACPALLVFFFFMSLLKRKMIQTMEMNAYQLLVAISSRLPQSQISHTLNTKQIPMLTASGCWFFYLRFWISFGKALAEACLSCTYWNLWSSNTKVDTGTDFEKKKKFFLHYIFWTNKKIHLQLNCPEKWLSRIWQVWIYFIYKAYCFLL